MEVVDGSRSSGASFNSSTMLLLMAILMIRSQVVCFGWKHVSFIYHLAHLIFSLAAYMILAPK
jgi:hypothetical protein